MNCLTMVVDSSQSRKFGISKEQLETLLSQPYGLRRLITRKLYFPVQADADHLPFQEGIFNDAFSFTVLQNMPKPSQTLAEIRRVTVRGGKMAITGLKKAFPQTSFHDIVESSGMAIKAFIDENDINCYLAVLST